MARTPEFFTVMESWFKLQTQLDEPTEPQKTVHAALFSALDEDETTAFYEAVGPMVSASQRLDIKRRRF